MDDEIGMSAWTARSYADEHEYGPLEPYIMLYHESDPLGRVPYSATARMVSPGDSLSSESLRHYQTVSQPDGPDIYLISGACGPDAYGTDLIAETNYEVLAVFEPCLVRVTYLNTDQWAILAGTPLPQALADMLDSLESYACLDESLWSEKETEHADRDWEDYGREEMRQEVSDELHWLMYGSRPTRRSDYDDTGAAAVTDATLDGAMADAVYAGAVEQYHETGGGTVWRGLVDVAKDVAARFHVKRAGERG